MMPLQACLREYLDAIQLAKTIDVVSIKEKSFGSKVLVTCVCRLFGLLRNFFFRLKSTIGILNPDTYIGKLHKDWFSRNTIIIEDVDDEEDEIPIEEF
jgi:hypothetical protein